MVALKKSLKFLLLLIILSLNLNLKAQNITGHIYALDSSGIKRPLQGANVHFSGKNKGCTTDSSGFYSLNKKTNTCLVASFVGLLPDSIFIANTESSSPVNFVLKENHKLNEVIIKGNQRGTFLGKPDILKTEHITSSGLTKMACCNLSESFENSATITSGYTDAVSGAKQIQLLGLSGAYCQVLSENIPVMRGLANAFGWNYTPGTWLESIQISKGTSSVTNGYEAITGQINLEFKKPDKPEDFYADVYADEHNFYQLNMASSKKITPNLWSNLLVNASLSSWSDVLWEKLTNYNYHDKNGDHFMDMPKTKLVNLYNRWLYVSPSKRVQSRTGFQFLHEDRFGGQSPICHKADVYYTTDIVNQGISVYNKTGLSVGNKPGQSIGFINNYSYYKLESLFGPTQTYKLFYGYQKSFTSNLLFNSYLGNTNHQYSVGVSFLFDNYETLFKDNLTENYTPLTNFNRREIVPGAFGQYTYTSDKLTFILGIREDYNSKYGWLFTPRTNLRFELTKNIILRASAGRGYKAPNVISDNLGLMASTRKFYTDSINNLKIEEAWNFGGNVTFYIPVGNNKKILLSIDYFKIIYTNSVIVDEDRNKNNVFFYNSAKANYSNVWQSDITFPALFGFEAYAAFRYNRSWETLTEGNDNYLVEKPLTSRYRGLFNLSYATKFRKWIFDFTAQLNGPSRIPGKTGYISMGEESPLYPVYFAQITKRTKRVDCYAGVENIADYRQPNPIINAENPFVKGFDASQIWGPLEGRKIYIGIKFRLGKMYNSN